MCGRCEGEPYRGVPMLFNGDRQSKKGGGLDRQEWLIISSDVIVYLGKTALPKGVENPLFRGCEEAIRGLTPYEHEVLGILSNRFARSATGNA